MSTSSRTDFGIHSHDIRLSIVVPTYNERDSIERTIAAILDHSPPETEIIVVDDDSPDKTWAVVAKKYADTPQIKVERRTGERGLGAAIFHGFRRASGSHYLVMDADLQHPPSVIPEMIQAARDGADVVIGTRYGKGGEIQGWSLPRRIISRGAIALAHLSLPATRSVSDPVSGFFLVHAGVLDDVSIEPRGWKILLDVLVCADGSIEEVAYRFQDRELGLSKLTVSDYFTYLVHLVDLWRVSRRRDDPSDQPLHASESAD